MIPKTPSDPGVWRLDMLIDIACGCERCKKAALWEVDLADVLKDDWNTLTTELLASTEVRDLMQYMADPKNLIMTPEGVQFTPAAWARYESVAEQYLGANMAAKVAPQVSNMVCKEYRRAQLDGAARSQSLGARFRLKDTAAVENLSNNTMYWVKEGSVRNVNPRIAQIVQNGLDQGFGRDDLANTLRKELGKQYAVEASRWDVVASSALTRARNSARLRQMTTWGVITVNFSNPQDERTSAICNSLAGRQFQTSRLIEVLDSIEGAATPEGAIDAQPWYSQTTAGQWKASTSSGRKDVTFDDIVASGAVIPPLHGRCRSLLLADLEQQTSYDETLIDQGAVVKKEQKPVSTPKTRDKRPVSEVLNALAMTAPAVASSFTAGEVVAATAVSEGGAEYLRTAETWNATGDSFGLTTQWIEDASDQMVSSFNTAVSADRIAVVNAALRRTPAATWERVADNTAALAAAHSIPASITLDAGSVDPAAAWSFRRWHLRGEGLARFEAFLEEQGYADTLSGVDVWDVATDAPIQDWLGLTVDGRNPVMEFFQAGGRVELEILP